MSVYPSGEEGHFPLPPSLLFKVRCNRNGNNFLEIRSAESFTARARTRLRESDVCFVFFTFKSLMTSLNFSWEFCRVPSLSHHWARGIYAMQTFSALLSSWYFLPARPPCCMPVLTSLMRTEPVQSLGEKCQVCGSLHGWKHNERRREWRREGGRKRGRQGRSQPWQIWGRWGNQGRSRSSELDMQRMTCAAICLCIDPPVHFSSADFICSHR